VVKPVGGNVLRNVDGRARVQRVFAPLERGLNRLADIDPVKARGWIERVV
jgi:hypothetical protein